MKHCLIVDDSSSIRKVARRILEDANFRTSEAENRADALDMCRTEMPDCIVVDWQMPDGDAMKFLTKLRALPGGSRPTVMYLTSENDPVQRRPRDAQRRRRAHDEAVRPRAAS